MVEQPLSASKQPLTIRRIIIKAGTTAGAEIGSVSMRRSILAAVPDQKHTKIDSWKSAELPVITFRGLGVAR